MTLPIPGPALEAPDIQAALAEIARYDEHRTRYISALETFVERNLEKHRLELEEVRQEAGMQRARAEAAEARPTIEVRRDNSGARTVEVLVDGEVAATTDYDEVGWSGLDAVERAAVAVARACGVGMADRG